jgi:hypothetical protein
LGFLSKGGSILLKISPEITNSVPDGGNYLKNGKKQAEIAILTRFMANVAAKCGEFRFRA